MTTAWRNEPQAVALSQRMLSHLHARWRAGTLITQTPDEVFFCGELRKKQAKIGAQLYIVAAADSLTWWPPLRTAEEDNARLCAVRDALVCAIDTFFPAAMHAMAAERYKLDLPFPAWSALFNLLRHTLRTAAAGGWLERLQAVVGLTRAQVAALERVAPGVVQGMDQFKRAEAQTSAERRERAAADVARHGLRTCALPECDAAAEPHPKAFKLCSRCRGAAYCSAAHQQADWRRHKRNDGCATATPQ
jgi:hypothetical protein